MKTVDMPAFFKIGYLCPLCKHPGSEFVEE